MVCLSKPLAGKLSNISRLVICSKVSNNIQLIDPLTAQYSDMRPTQFWEAPFRVLCEINDLVEFYIIDVQIEKRVGKFAIATCEIAKSDDLNTTWLVKTHLGNILNPGDHCKGYMIANSNFNHDIWEDFMLKNKSDIPDIILVRKSFPYARKKTRKRNWKLKNMAKTEDLDNRNQTKAEKLAAERDLELFLRDVEEDKELRQMINLFKDDTLEIDTSDGDDEMEDEVEEEEDFPAIQADELLEDMDALRIEDDEEMAE